MNTQLLEFRFYEELNDFLPEDRRRRSFSYGLKAKASVKDVIEALGVPHCEVDLVLVDGCSVGFAHCLQGGERVAVYPVFEAFDISTISRVRAQPLRTTRFVVDANLGKLATYLRLFGFDASYDRQLDDAELVALARAEHRIIVTRDKALLKRRDVDHGLWVRTHQPKLQIAEVLHRLQLQARVKPFSRCLFCNAQLAEVELARLPAPVLALVPLDVRRDVEQQGATSPGKMAFCEECQKPYWQGSHYRRMQEFCYEIIGDFV